MKQLDFKIFDVFVWLFDGVYLHFQQYFSYIVAVSLLVEETRGPGENH
jgi:hypothetical protein